MHHIRYGARPEVQASVDLTVASAQIDVREAFRRGTDIGNGIVLARRDEHLYEAVIAWGIEDLLESWLAKRVCHPPEVTSGFQNVEHARGGEDLPRPGSPVDKPQIHFRIRCQPAGPNIAAVVQEIQGIGGNKELLDRRSPGKDAWCL